MAAPHGRELLGRDHAPITYPEVELTAFAAVVAGSLIVLGLPQELRKPRVAAQAGEVVIREHEIRSSTTLLHGIGERGKSLLRVTGSGKHERDLVLNVSRRCTVGPCTLIGRQCLFIL